MTVILIILGVAVLLYFFFKLFKIPKLGDLVLVTGGVKCGKSTLAVHFVMKRYSGALLAMVGSRACRARPQASNTKTMKSEITYCCEICGKKSKNRVLIANHEKQCKITYEAERQLERRLTALFALLRKQGYRLVISIDDKYGNEIIVVKYVI